ncbi:permease of the drug/metabolite transporter (DMT) superfamily [Thermus aquaticus Y51MC23]|uniref:Permease of the drug/metabolite transporter (DMT) superfamily n=1 Tax=Thermus aquaticus (strain ATCC BAA-2747 / Y51MC23) TaxID=498848 RepID=A0ABN4IJ38_THEA5|nr:permease of the drug/metabolite transporter (DMT) superfamily [Thermus aquaticus Y51MC23]
MERPPWKDPLVYLPPLLWALNRVALRAAMREMPPEWGSFLRFALALPFFLLLLRRLPGLFPLGETLFLALFGVTLFNLVFFSRMRLAPASDASAVAAVYPLSTAFAYSLYFRKPLPRNLLMGLLLSGAGVVLLALGHAGGGGGEGEASWGSSPGPGGFHVGGLQRGRGPGGGQAARVGGHRGQHALGKPLPPSPGPYQALSRGQRERLAFPPLHRVGRGFPSLHPVGRGLGWSCQDVCVGRRL